MTQSRSLSAVEEAASAWFMRRRERASDASAEQAFQVWLAQSPLHRQEYDKLAQVWDDLAALPRPASAPDRASTGAAHIAPADAAQPIGIATRRPAAARQPRPAFLRWGGALAALVLLAGAAYQYLPVNYESVANASTQTRSLDLADGTRIHANVGTRVNVRYTLAERRIDIESGEVYIDAAPDRRPLLVSAGGARLRDIGTEFNVLLLPDLLQVGVRSGQVMLEAVGAHPGAARRSRRLAGRRGGGARRHPATAGRLPGPVPQRAAALRRRPRPPPAAVRYAGPAPP
ncbi:MAG: FecR domain-containing protein [Achromobacter xylosoxidans]|nr:FecR domain-containing protein [Achromobacter xylosoxidans]